MGSAPSTGDRSSQVRSTHLLPHLTSLPPLYTVTRQLKWHLCGVKGSERGLRCLVTDGAKIWEKVVSVDELREMKEALEKGETSISWWQFFSAITIAIRAANKKLSLNFPEPTLCKFSLELVFPVIGRTIVTLNLREVERDESRADSMRLGILNVFYSTWRRSKSFTPVEIDENGVIIDQKDMKKDEKSNVDRALQMEKEKNVALEEKVRRLEQRLRLSEKRSSNLVVQNVDDRDGEKSDSSLIDMKAGDSTTTDDFFQQEGHRFPSQSIMRFLKDYRTRLVERNVLSEKELSDFENTVMTLTHQQSMYENDLAHERDSIDSEVLEWLKKRFLSKKRKKRNKIAEESSTMVSAVGNQKTREAIMQMFERVDQWNFDVFTLDALCEGRTLFTTAYTLFFKYDLVHKFLIEEEVLVNLLKEIESGYHPNPYHNAMHACDVTQVLHVILHKGGLSQYLTDEDIFAALIASVIHDFDHPGLNNAFQVNTNSYLALIYNDRSVLENHHVAHAFELMSLKQYDILAGVPAHKRKEVRETVISMVLATDMANHGKYVNRFKQRLDADADFTSKEDTRLALQIAIKMADVSNPARPLHIYLQWTEKIIDEFFSQGDRERELGIPVSPLMDRETSKIARGQQAFMDFVITPMFESFSVLLPKMKFAIEYIKVNRKYWNNHDHIERADFQDSSNRINADI